MEPTKGGFFMPTISMFYGIIIRMQSEKNGKHHVPHIHCIYGENELVIGLDGTVLEGKMPKKQLKLIDAWIALHEDELKANWQLLSDGDGFFKIDPLK
jgi:hypothetical protein